MIYKETEIREAQVLEIGKAMLLAARTAPKARGMDVLDLVLLSGEDMYQIAKQMREFGEQTEQAFFVRDAANIENAQALVLVGAKFRVLALNCGLCGAVDCQEKNQNDKQPCAFNLIDLGIALGSAVSIASDAKIDNRIMYSVGKIAQDLNYLPGADIVLGIPLSVSSKSPFFDR